MDAGAILSLAVGTAAFLALSSFFVSQAVRDRRRRIRDAKGARHVSIGDAVTWVLTTDVNMYVALLCSVMLIVASVTADDWAPNVWLFTVTCSTLLATASLVQWTIVMCIEMARVGNKQIDVHDNV